MNLPDLEGWAIFATVAEQRSFSGAARALGVSKATVSKAITRLETRLGTRLFHRTSRKLTLTENGREAAERARRLLADAQAAEDCARETASAPSGLVRVTAPTTFGLLHVAPAIATFLAEYPAISVELKLTDLRSDLVAEGIDVAVRIGDLPDSSLRAQRVGDVAMRTVAAPSYLDRNGTPAHPNELLQHRCLIYTNAPGWQFRDPGGNPLTLHPSGPLLSDSGEAILPALLGGLGIAWLPGFFADAPLAEGRLHAILTDWQAAPIGVHLVTPPGGLRPQRVERLIAHLAEQFRSACVGRE